MPYDFYDPYSEYLLLILRLQHCITRCMYVTLNVCKLIKIDLLNVILETMNIKFKVNKIQTYVINYLIKSKQKKIKNSPISPLTGAWEIC